jgi:hypothetical protein
MGAFSKLMEAERAKNDGIPVLVCHHCRGRRDAPCRHCSNTGKMFWVSGYGFPYTPDGETRALRELDRQLNKDEE